MNKTAIKNFAVWARNKLEKDIKDAAGLRGVSDKGIAQPLPQSTDDLLFLDIGTKEYAKVEGKAAIAQRKALIDRIKGKEADMGYDRPCIQGSYRRNCLHLVQPFDCYSFYGGQRLSTYQKSYAVL